MQLMALFSDWLMGILMSMMLNEFAKFEESRLARTKYSVTDE